MKIRLHGTATSQFLRPDTGVRSVPGSHALPVLLLAALQFSAVSGAADAAVARGFNSPIDEVDEFESGSVAAGDYDKLPKVDPPPPPEPPIFKNGFES